MQSLSDIAAILNGLDKVSFSLAQDHKSDGLNKGLGPWLKSDNDGKIWSYASFFQLDWDMAGIQPFRDLRL